MFGFCIVEIHKVKIMPLLTFQAKCASNLVDAKKTKKNKKKKQTKLVKVQMQNSYNT